MEFLDLSKKRYLYGQEYALSKVAEYSEFGIYCVVSFVIPLLLKHPQLLVGSAVNCALILAAFNLKGYKNIPIIIFPSLAVLLNGLIFGQFSIFLIYMIPFIWLANGVLVFLTKYLIFEKQMNRYLALTLSITMKVGLLFIAAYALVSFGIIPAMFLVAMGMMQVYSAVIGAVAAVSIQEAKNAVYSAKKQE